MQCRMFICYNYLCNHQVRVSEITTVYKAHLQKYILYIHMYMCMCLSVLNKISLEYTKFYINCACIAWPTPHFTFSVSILKDLFPNFVPVRYYFLLIVPAYSQFCFPGIYTSRINDFLFQIYLYFPYLKGFVVHYYSFSYYTHIPALILSATTDRVSAHTIFNVYMYILV